VLVTFNNRGQKVYQRGGLFVGEAIRLRRVDVVQHAWNMFGQAVEAPSCSIGWTVCMSRRWKSRRRTCGLTDDFECLRDGGSPIALNRLLQLSAFQPRAPSKPIGSMLSR
jgi:hypothetical protein